MAIPTKVSDAGKLLLLWRRGGLKARKDRESRIKIAKKKAIKIRPGKKRSERGGKQEMKPAKKSKAKVMAMAAAQKFRPSATGRAGYGGSTSSSYATR